MSKIRYLTFSILICMSAACGTQQSIQSAISQTQAAWTPVPTQTAYPTLSPAPAILVTQVVVWTPTPENLDSACKPITNMDYSDNTKVMILLQAYVSALPGVKTVSLVIPEKLYNNSTSQLFYIHYVSSDDGKVYSKRYIVYLKEFGWKNAVFSIDGQCWIDPPHN